MLPSAGRSFAVQSSRHFRKQFFTEIYVIRLGILSFSHTFTAYSHNIFRQYWMKSVRRFSVPTTGWLQIAVKFQDGGSMLNTLTDSNRYFWRACLAATIFSAAPMAHGAPLSNGTVLTIKQGGTGYPEGTCTGSYVRFLNNAILC